MALTDTTVPYEILFRFDLNGAIQAAQQQKRRLVRDGDTILVDQILPAEALGTDSFPTSDVMTTATQQALQQVGALTLQVKQLQDDLAAALAAIPAAQDVAATEPQEQEAV